ncbi:MAG: 30S ribosomal protein S19 [Candidatus Diapherotrites archaeon]|nr:30S ribosomal protein S19 [Candidatus Diapherotrites archaeon]
MAKQFMFKGKTIEELKEMKLDDFFQLLPTRMKRSYKRGWSKDQETFLKQVRREGKDVVRTHCRDMIIIPEMVGRKIAVYNGKEFNYLDIQPEMLGHYLGEYALTRKVVKHSAAGIGATRSTKFISVK